MNEWLTEWAQWIAGIHAELLKSIALDFIFFFGIFLRILVPINCKLFGYKDWN